MIRASARWVAVLFVMILQGQTARAEEVLLFPYTLNGVPKGDIPLVLDGEDIWVEVEALAAGGLRLDDLGARRTIEGQAFVSLASLAPRVRFTLDEITVSVRIDADPELLGVTRIARGNARPPGIEYLPARGGFMNYRMTSTGFDRFSGFFDGGWNVRGNLLYTGLTLDPDEGLIRGLTNFVIDDPEKLRRTTIGDAITFSDFLGGAPTIAGVTIQREFLLDPYFVRYPSLSLAGEATTPSTVEVYLNGSMVDRRQIPPGRFEIDNFSVPSGRGDATVVVRDAFGVERVITQPFYLSSQLLSEGLSEYRYSLGFQRDTASLESFDYGDPALLASHRWGLTDDLTVAYRAEASDDLFSGGGSVAYRSLLGEVGLQAGFSGGGGSSGRAVAARYAFLSRAGSAILSYRAASDHYANLTLDPALDRVTEEVSLSASKRFRRVDVGIDANLREFRDAERQARAALRVSMPLGDRATVFASAGVSELAGETSPEIYAAVTWDLGFLRSANFRFNHANDASSGGVTVQQNLGRQIGWGYRVDATADDEGERSQVVLQRQTRNALFELEAFPGEASDAIALSAAGGLAWTGREGFLMRPGQQSYAIIRVPGLEGVRVYVSNIEVGRTNAEGELVVTDLLPYYGNRIRIDDRDIPITYRIGRTERVIAPPLRGGVIVPFDVEAVRPVYGTIALVTAGEERVAPAYGELTLDVEGRGPVESPLGQSGEFYFEDLPAGRWPGRVISDRGDCAVVIEVPAGGIDPLELATITCQETSP